MLYGVLRTGWSLCYYSHQLDVTSDSHALCSFILHAFIFHASVLRKDYILHDYHTHMLCTYPPTFGPMQHARSPGLGSARLEQDRRDGIDTRPTDMVKGWTDDSSYRNPPERCDVPPWLFLQFFGVWNWLCDWRVGWMNVMTLSLN